MPLWIWVVLLFAVFALIQHLVFKHKLKRKDAYIQELETKIQGLEARIEELEAVLPQARQEAESIIQNARDKAHSIIKTAEGEAQITLNSAKKEAETIIKKAKDEALATIEDARTRAKRIIGRSYEVAEMITQEAYENARNISAEIFEKLDRMHELEKTIKAYENMLKNYEYEFTLKETIILDTLAEAYAYTEAGQKLKEAREKTKKIVERQRAAISEYADPERRKIAMNFIVELFNAKVSAIVAKIRHDNYDKLKQQIIDAYHVVNYLGSAFRNTKITAEYLNARLEELKWAVIVAKIKRDELEEQRRIREQMREEEKARREREKALEQARKEEEMLRKAMEMAEKKLAAAAEKEKAELQAELEKLREKLKEAEEKTKKAKAMAQLTKSGHIYIISNIGSFGENVYKVGMTRRLDPMERIRELGDASVPFPFDVHAIIYSDNAPALESKLHRFLEDKRVNKVNPRKEFFRVTLREIREFLEKEGIKAQWTMKAEAAEYRESLAIEQRMKQAKEATEEEKSATG